MMTLSPGSYLRGGDYKIIKTLGQGGFGITYLAEQTMLQRNVCIKEFFPKTLCERDAATSMVSTGTSSNQELMSRYLDKFIKESLTIAKLSHPNIVRIIDAFRENNTAYYVTDFIDGGNLNDLVQNNGALDESTALKYIRQVGDGLSYVHAQGINHLDVKPANIMLNKKDDSVILIDFGLSKHYDVEGGQTSSTPIGVSSGYAPLEQYKEGGVKEFSPQTDVYSLGATLYRLVTGLVPPQAADVMDEGLPEMSSKISQQTRSAIEKAMQFRKRDRYETVANFLSALPTSTDSNVSVACEDEVTSLLKQDETSSATIILESQDTKDAFSEKLVPAQENMKWGFVDGCGKVIIPFIYDDARNFSEGLACVLFDGKWGYIDETGKAIIPFLYDNARNFSEGLAAVSTFKNKWWQSSHHQSWGFVDRTGNVAIPFIYEDAKIFSEGLVSVKKGDKWGFIDAVGKVVIPFIYESAWRFSGSRATVKKCGRWGVIDKEGKSIVSFNSNSPCV